MLKDVGEFLVTHLRHHDVACRTGGDEFSVLLPDLSADDCGHLTGRLRDALAAANAERRIPISFSVGTASWPEAGDSAERSQTRADEAMYADKRGRKSGDALAAGPRQAAPRRRAGTGSGTGRSARLPAAAAPRRTRLAALVRRRSGPNASV